MNAVIKTWQERAAEADDWLAGMASGLGLREKYMQAEIADLRAALAAATAPIVAQPVVPDGWSLVPKEPTPEMVKAMVESRARDDEGEFPALHDLIDFSGENKTRAVIMAAYRALLASAPAAPADGEA